MRKKQIIALFCICISVLLCGCTDRNREILLPIEIEAAESADAGSTDTKETGIEAVVQNGAVCDESTQTKIYVYVCGAVVSPGVVELAADSRAEKALQAAGGFSEDAARDEVNLAAKVEDGQKLYFPTAEEASALRTSVQNVQDGLVNLNTADEEQLCTLPGIGAAKAQDIITYRETNGAFKVPEDIMKVPGIKESAYIKMREKVTVN